MATNKATAQKELEKDTRGGKRRERILKSFHECIINQGYSKTTLRDVAKGADMSASHLLYYFPGKDAILQFYFDDVSARITQKIDSFKDQDAATQFGLLADLFFAGRGISNSETGFMLECFGVAVHDPQLHSEKAELDRFCKNHLQGLFARIPGTKANAADHAEIAYAMLIGLRTAAFFDERLSLSSARRLFHDGVMIQAGLKPLN